MANKSVKFVHAPNLGIAVKDNKKQNYGKSKGKQKEFKLLWELLCKSHSQTMCYAAYSSVNLLVQ